MWLREHRVAMAFTSSLMSVGAFSVLGVGNVGVPWAWSAPEAARVEAVGPGIERGVVLRPLSSLPKGDLNPLFGGVHAIALEEGRWQGAADPRRDGKGGFVEGAR